jgi:hypothetical protein
MLDGDSLTHMDQGLIRVRNRQGQKQGPISCSLRVRTLFMSHTPKDGTEGSC